MQANIYPIAFALKATGAGRTGLRDRASSSTPRSNSKPGAPRQAVFLRFISSISEAQDLASDTPLNAHNGPLWRPVRSFSIRARMVGVFSMARRNRYQ